MFLHELFASFLKEKTFLVGISPKTVRSYKQAFNAYQRVLSSCEKGTSNADEVPTKDTLKDFVIGMREAGLSPGACNVYIRSINSFLSWLHVESHITEPLKIKQLNRNWFHRYAGHNHKLSRRRRRKIEQHVIFD